MRHLLLGASRLPSGVQYDERASMRPVPQHGGRGRGSPGAEIGREEREERVMAGKEGRAARWLVPVLIFVGTLAALTWIRVRRLGLWAILTGMACVILGYGIAWWRQERPRR